MWTPLPHPQIYPVFFPTETSCFVNTLVLSSSQPFFGRSRDDSAANLNLSSNNILVFYQEAFPHVPESSSIPWISLLGDVLFIFLFMIYLRKEWSVAVSITSTFLDCSCSWMKLLRADSHYCRKCGQPRPSAEVGHFADWWIGFGSARVGITARFDCLLSTHIVRAALTCRDSNDQ